MPEGVRGGEQDRRLERQRDDQCHIGSAIPVHDRRFRAHWALFADFRDEYRARRRGSFPRGENRPSIRTTWRFRHDVLNLLLESYQRHGPIFGLRIVFGYNLAMIGPEANHFMLVSGRENFGWRHGRMATC